MKLVDHLKVDTWWKKTKNPLQWLKKFTFTIRKYSLKKALYRNRFKLHFTKNKSKINDNETRKKYFQIMQVIHLMLLESWFHADLAALIKKKIDMRKQIYTSI